MDLLNELADDVIIIDISNKDIEGKIKLLFWIIYHLI